MRLHLLLLCTLLLAPPARGGLQDVDLIEGSEVQRSAEQEEESRDESQAAPVQEPVQVPVPELEQAELDEATSPIDEARAEEAEAVEAEAAEPEPVLQTAESWYERADELVLAIQAGEKTSEDADALFNELEPVLRDALDAHHGAFREARHASDPIPDWTKEAIDFELDLGETVEDLYTSLDKLYSARLRLLKVVTPGLRESLVGNGVVGVEQFWLEVDFITRLVRYQRIAVPDGVVEVQRRLRAAPVPIVLTGLILLMALIAFRFWRKWASTGIPRLRELTRLAWRHHPAARVFGEVLRYFESVRRPLEWILLCALVFSLANVREVHELEGLLRITVFWILCAWLSVNLANAFALRERRGRVVQRSKARLRSLRIIASWGVVLGLGLQLSTQLVGKGTIYAWVWHLFELLVIPVVALLLLTWRPAIHAKLQREARFSTWVAALLKRRGFLGNMFATVGGMAYLAAIWLRRLALKLARRTALGRTLVAEALRQSMLRSSSEEGGELAGKEMDADLRKSWLRGEDVVESAVADEFAEVTDLLERGWNNILLIGERGGGKSVFLRRLATAREGKTLVVSCPHGGVEQAMAAIGRALQLEEAAPNAEQVHEAARAQGVRLIALDDLHRISRPVLGGQVELDRLMELVSSWQDVPIIAAIDAAAWEYFGRMREGSITGASTIRLSAWTEGQIGELLESRAREVGMELDYGRLRFPRMLLEQEFDSPEEGLRASYRRILWAEAEGNPEVAIRLVTERLIEKEDGDALLRLPKNPPASELEGMTLVELLVLRFIIQTDGALAEEMVAGLRYPQAVIDSALSTAEMRGLIEENHGRYRISWKWYRMVTRVLARRNMLGSARQRKESAEAQPDQRRARPQHYVAIGPQR